MARRDPQSPRRAGEYRLIFNPVAPETEPLVSPVQSVEDAVATVRMLMATFRYAEQKGLLTQPLRPLYNLEVAQLHGDALVWKPYISADGKVLYYIVSALSYDYRSSTTCHACGHVNATQDNLFDCTRCGTTVAAG